jgi:predicted acylesterase/phospholipase RssA
MLRSHSELLEKTKKKPLAQPREDLVFAKGKGMMKTYFVRPLKTKYTQLNSNTTQNFSDAAHWGTLSFLNHFETCRVMISDKQERLIDWCTEILSQSLPAVILSREIAYEENEKKLVATI